MKLHTPVMERLVAGITLGLAFVVMASIIVPDHSAADDGGDASHGVHGIHAPAPDVASSHHGGASDHAPAGHPAHAPTPSSGGSVDAHEGLRPLGSLESRGFIIDFYATSVGPRYTVCDASGEELGTLLSLEQIEQHFPELPLPGLDFSGDGLSATSTIMLAEPDVGPF